jgi:DNA replication protein DnaC
MAQQCETLRRQLGERYSPERSSLASFVIEYEEQRKIISGVIDLIGVLQKHVEAGRGVIFLGTVGTGKDHLLACLLYAATGERISCAWANGQELFGSFRDAIDTGRRDEDIFRELCRPRVLALSDPIPPVGDPGKWDIGNLYRLLDRRYRSLKSTWVSLNASSEAEADARLSAPVFDRMREGAAIFRCFWPSYREERRQ